MTRLVAFGDSFTQGIGIDGMPGDSTLPNPWAWPQLTADILGLECVNYGRGGAAPLGILENITYFDFNPDDIVIIGWPFHGRMPIYNDNSWHYTIQPYCGNYEADSFFVEHFTEYHTIRTLDMCIKLSDEFLKHKVANVIQRDYVATYNMLDILDIYGRDEESKVIETFPNIARLEEGLTQHLDQKQYHCADGHFEKEHHQLYAEQLAERILHGTLINNGVKDPD